MDGGTLDMCVGDFTTSQVLIGCFPNTFKITKSQFIHIPKATSKIRVSKYHFQFQRKP